MSTATTVNFQQEEFPVGFAEHKDNYYQIDDNTVFYVEWLDNSSEFPGLSSPNESNLTDGNWELLQRKEVNDEEHSLIPVEDDAWSKLTAPGGEELYANVAEKNAAELQPTKRNIQPLWSNITKKRATNKKDEEVTTIDEDVYQDDLAYEILDAHKAQSRRANRMTRKRQVHDLKTVEFHVEGVLRLATSNNGVTDATWVPYENNVKTLDEHSKKNVVDTYVHALSAFSKLTNKSQALTYTAKFTHNVKRYTYKCSSATVDPKRPVFPDNSEFSVHSAIIRK
jgi:hypothetical protein